MEENWASLGSLLRRFIGRRVNDPHVVDDVTQDVLLKVQSHLGSLPPEHKLPAWVLTVARNAIIDHYRARSVRSHRDVSEVEPVADGSNAARAEMLSELTPCLTRMVEELPEPYRGAMRLADLDGLSQQEVADRLGISLSAAKSRVQRAREKLRTNILDCCRIEHDARGNVMDYETTARSPRYCGGGGGDDKSAHQCG